MKKKIFNDLQVYEEMIDENGEEYFAEVLEILPKKDEAEKLLKKVLDDLKQLWEKFKKYKEIAEHYNPNIECKYDDIACDMFLSLHGIDLKKYLKKGERIGTIIFTFKKPYKK